MTKGSVAVLKEDENSNFKIISIIVDYKCYNPHLFLEIFHSNEKICKGMTTRSASVLKEDENSNFKMISIIVSFKSYDPHIFFSYFILMTKMHLNIN